MKKTGLLILLLFTLFLASGCGSKGDLDYVDNIKPEEIFEQEEDKYYVYFHRLDCADCEQSDPKVMEYGYITDEYEGCSEKRKIYAVLLYTESEKPGKDTYIYRQYTGSDGEGTDGKYYVTGVTDWEDLYIATTASMISITTDKNGKKVAAYVAQGSAEINARLEEQLGNCYQ